MDRVAVRDEKRLFPVYGMAEAVQLPMFAENRVHQRSSGDPYPNKVVMGVDRSRKEMKELRVITLENAYLRLELLPELGGRIYSAFDKRTGYDFFYRQHVIKPALIGLLGSWISGGCEFNWPCHHRPGTYMPVDVSVEEAEDGTVTVWMSDNEPLDRMKGMVGIALKPGEARFDTRMRVYNRTPRRHSFLWWENAAVPVNEDYRLVFPPDVSYVQFHYRKNVTTYPVASGVYNGIRMGEGTDLSFHKNTRRPTSYFCGETKYDFFGGYDEGRRCGVIHVADRSVSVGKKMFTWAYSQLSQSWEKALTDTDGPYAELMASSFSLNQPDFAWLMPYEGKSFSQMWYPVGDIGLPLCACAEAAVSVNVGEVRLQAAAPFEGTIAVNGREHPVKAGPDKIETIPASGEVNEIVLRDAAGRCLLRYMKPQKKSARLPDPLPDNPSLDQMRTAQEATLMAVHVEQYRDPAARPDGYLKKALELDPEYVPALTLLAARELDCLRPEKALALAERAWRKATWRNYHPESGEIEYLMGRILEALGREDEAYDWYLRSAWAEDCRSRALTRAAMAACRRGDPWAAERLAREALEAHGANETAQLCLAVAQRQLKRPEAEETLSDLLKKDPLYQPARFLLLGASEEFYAGIGADRAQSCLDLAEDLIAIGEKDAAARALENLGEKTSVTEIVRAWLTGDEGALDTLPAGCGIAYPGRPMEARALEWALGKRPGCAVISDLAACLKYARGHHEAAAALWRRAAEADPGAAAPRRDLAVAYYSHLGKRDEALEYLDEALHLAPGDGQLVWEKALLMHRLRRPPEETAAFLEGAGCSREDVVIELCRAYQGTGEYDRALSLLDRTDFTPCEGGEHAVAEQYMLAWHGLGRRALRARQPEEALRCFKSAQVLPDHLGAGLWNDVLLVPHRYFEGMALKALSREAEAREAFGWILEFKQDYFTDMFLPELPCWQAATLTAMGRAPEAEKLCAEHLSRWAQAARREDAGYFRTTPFFISYMEDPAAQRAAACLWQEAMAHFALGDLERAAALAEKSLEKDPLNLYGLLIAKGL